MRELMTEFQKETGNFYNLEATPAEATGYRLAKLDQEKYPTIFKNLHLAEEQKESCYTNSSQLPIDYTDDIFKMLDLQDELQTKYPGGTVAHIFLGESKIDPNTLKNFIKKVFDNYHMPYISITPTFSICSKHGYFSGIKEECPKCSGPMEIYSRLVGYYRPTTQWNKGKQAEFKHRKFYELDKNN